MNLGSISRHGSGGNDRRVLLLSPFAPRLDASMGGPRVIAQLITALAERERIGLLYMRSREEPPADEHVRAACELIVETPCAPAVTAGLGKRVRAGLSTLEGQPNWVREWSSPEFAMTLRSIVAGWQPDVVQAEFHVMGQYLMGLDTEGAPTILNQHEPGATAAEDRRGAGLMPGRILPMLEVRAWRRYEGQLLRAVDAVVTFTPRDQREMQSVDERSRVEVIAPGAVIPSEAADPLGQPPPTLLFFGNYVHAPNVDAAVRLARDIYPPLREQVPDLRLALPGDRAPDAVRRLASEQICVPGRVPDLISYLNQAAVVVVPLRLGGGMRVKVLEAISAGKAVVASGLALEGLDLRDGEHVLVAESEEEFVQRVGWLLAHPEERVALACRARVWAMTHLSWERAARQYEALYEDLLRPGRNDRATKR